VTTGQDRGGAGDETGGFTPTDQPATPPGSEGPLDDRPWPLPEAWQEGPYGYPPFSFMRLPFSRALHEFDVAVVGVPFDLGVTRRAGAKYGPRGIRFSSQGLRQYPMTRDELWGPFRSLRVVDYGDLALVPAYIEDNLKRIEEALTPVFAAGVTPLCFGGDHAVTLALLRACARTHGSVGLIHFDAHPDVWPPPAPERPYHHGTVYHHAVAEGLIDLDRSIQVGIRGSISMTIVEHARALGFQLITADEFFELSVRATVAEMRARAGDRPVYISLDIDCTDPAFAPGTGTPEIAGLSSRELLALVRGLRGLRVVGLDIVEVAPPYDSSELTTILAANLAYEMLEVVAARP
jgi:agmatinase